MNLRKLALSSLFFLLVFLAACQQSRQSPASSPTQDAALKPGYTDLTVPELQGMLQNKDFTFVNVHIPFEGNIANTDVSIPYDQIEKNLDKLPADKNAKIVLYCRSGRMSRIAADKLASLGYTNLFNLKGGMAAWQTAKLPIEK